MNTFIKNMDKTSLMHISPGDIADRLSILKIKLDNVTDPKKLQNIKNEYEMLRCEYTEDVTDLYKVNSVLWDVENELRLCEKRQDFGSLFVRLARLVYHTNDRRAAIKRAINKDSEIAEEKQYPEYEQTNKKTVGILNHLGLGDNLVCNGMIRHYAKTCNVITYVKKQYVQSVEYMYRDLGPSLIVVPVVDDQDAWSKQRPGTIRTGIFYGPHWNIQPPWCNSFYKNAGLDPSIMRSEFFVLRSRDCEERMYRQMIEHIGTDKYIVVHDDPERYTSIPVDTNFPIIRIGRGQFPIESTNIFDYCTLIERAVEYHGFDSSFMWLIELMKLRPKETTFLHRIRPATNPGYEEFDMTSNGTFP
jgi:hypothetical protein